MVGVVNTDEGCDGRLCLTKILERDFERYALDEFIWSYTEK